MNVRSHSLRLARIDVLRAVRKRTGDPSVGVIASLVLSGVMIVATTAGGVWGGRALGRALASGSIGVDPAVAASSARGIIGLLWLVGVALFVLRAVGQRGTLTNAEGTLTIVPTAEAYVGLLVAEYVYLLVWTMVPAVGVGLGLALGAASPWPVVGVPLLVVLGGASAVATGFLVGLTIRHVVTRFPFVARNKATLVVLAFVAYFVAIVTGSLGTVVSGLFDPMAASPLGWYADLALITTPGLAFTATHGTGALVTTVGIVVVGTAAGVRIARMHWFADPALAGEAQPEPTAEETDDRTTAVLERALDRPTAALVTLAWRRAVRAPLKLLYAAYPLFFLVGVVADIVQTGQVPAYLPYGLLLFVAWAGGVVFTLNPLGDQGSVLPTTLLSDVTGTRFVAAHVIAGVLVAVPVGTMLVLASALLSPLDATATALLVGLSPVAIVAAAALSVGIGSAFPRFEATSITRSMEAVIPSPWAFVLFSVHLVLTTISVSFVTVPLARSLGASLLSTVLPFGLAVGPTTLRWTSVALLAILLVLPAVSYRYAVRTFDEYVLA